MPHILVKVSLHFCTIDGIPNLQADLSCIWLIVPRVDHAGVAILTFDVYDGLPVQRLPLQRAGQDVDAEADGEEADGAKPPVCRNLHRSSAYQAQRTCWSRFAVCVSARFGQLDTSAHPSWLFAVGESPDVCTCLMLEGVAGGVTVLGGAADNGAILTGFEDLEAVLSPETAAASKAALSASANGAQANEDVAAPTAGVSLLGGLVTAKSKVSIGH
jgi:hypothetical protein